MNPRIIDFLTIPYSHPFSGWHYLQTLLSRSLLAYEDKRELLIR